MRNQLLAATFLLLLTGACHHDVQMGPSDSLYRRWHLLQSRKSQDSTWIVNSATDSDTEFRVDGALIYRSNGVITPTPCCASSRFERNDTAIRFLDTNGCPNALCTSLSSSNSFTITVLTDQRLEMKSGDWISQYTEVE